MNKHFRCNCGLAFMYGIGLDQHLSTEKNKDLHYEIRQAMVQEIGEDKQVSQEAKRDPSGVRYDILDPNFLHALAMLASIGAKKYGDLNWQKSKLKGDKSCVNHIHSHLGSYQMELAYDHLELGNNKKYHLIAIAFNAMMEFWYECQEDTPNEPNS